MAYADDPQLDKLSKDFRRLQHQKHRARGGVEASMLFDYLLYEGEHQSQQIQNAIITRAFKHEKDKNKIRGIINLARRAADRKIGRHWSIAHKFRATPNTKDPIAFDNADVISDQLIPALDAKLGQDTLRWRMLFWTVICGVSFEHVDWKEGVSQDIMPKYDEQTGQLLWNDSLTGAEVTEEVVQQLLASGRVQAERFTPSEEVMPIGDIGGDVYDPFRVFVDTTVPMVKMLGPDQRIYLADIRSFEWIKETFGSDAAANLKPSKDLSIIKTQLLDRGMPVSGLNLRDLLPLVHGSQDKDDPDMALVLTWYQPPNASNPRGQAGYFVPDQCQLHVGDLPYPEIPVVDVHWSAPAATMWTPGFLRDMQFISKFINKRFSQLGEAANAQIYEMLLLGGNLTSKDIPTDMPGVIPGGMTDEGMPLVQPVPRGNLPSFFPDSIRLSFETADMLGSSDLLSQRKFPGQLRGSLTIPMLQEILDSEDGPRFSHYAEQMSREKQMRINRVKEFYEPIRTLNYTGQDLRNEVLEFQKEKILAAGIDFTISYDPGSIFPELSAMREARVRERFQWAPGLYTNPRTGQVDWSAIATDLKYNDRQRDSIASQGRKLARQLVQLARNGKVTVVPGPPDPKTGKPSLRLLLDNQPLIVYPFWSHNVMMDEYEAVMQTTEFLQASPMFKRVLLTLHDNHRQILSQIDQARQASVENKMVQSAVAQATQQAAAKVASTTVDSVMEQILSQQEEMQQGSFQQLDQRVRQMIGDVQGQGGGGQPRPAIGGPMSGRRRLPQA